MLTPKQKHMIRIETGVNDLLFEPITPTVLSKCNNIVQKVAPGNMTLDGLEYLEGDYHEDTFEGTVYKRYYNQMFNEE